MKGRGGIEVRSAGSFIVRGASNSGAVSLNSDRDDVSWSDAKKHNERMLPRYAGNTSHPEPTFAINSTILVGRRVPHGLHRQGQPKPALKPARFRPNPACPRRGR